MAPRVLESAEKTENLMVEKKASWEPKSSANLDSVPKREGVGQGLQSSCSLSLGWGWETY